MFRRKLTSAVVLTLVLSGPALAGSPAPEGFSNDVAARLLEQITRGFITHDAGKVMSAFESARMPGYGGFRDNIQALFAKYESFRAAYRLRQSWPQGERGVVIVEFDLEGEPLEEGAAPLRRSAQLRFEFERGRSGWKIVDVAPRSFFS